MGMVAPHAMYPKVTTVIPETRFEIFFLITLSSQAARSLDKVRNHHKNGQVRGNYPAQRSSHFPGTFGNFRSGWSLHLRR